MIGCDASGHSVEHLAFTGIYGEAALCDGSTAMMLFEDEVDESEGCPRYWHSLWNVVMLSWTSLLVPGNRQPVNLPIASGSSFLGCPSGYAASIFENTLCEDGDGSNIFRALNPMQAEETYSMVTANRFWSQVFGVAFSNKRWLHFFMLVGPVAGLWAVLGGLLQMSSSRSRRFCSAGSFILRYLMPIGEILHLDSRGVLPLRRARMVIAQVSSRRA